MIKSHIRRPGAKLAASALLAAILARPCLAEEGAGKAAPARGPGLVVELGAGPDLGLDRLLRGGRLELALGAGGGGLQLSLAAALSYDAALGSLLAEAGLELGLGGGLRFRAGREIPLGEPALASGGSLARLEPSGWP